MINKPFLLNNPAGALLCLFVCACSGSRSATSLRSPSSVNTGLYEETRRKDSLLARKYAAVLHTTASVIGNSLPLYRYIDRYLNTPFSKTPSDKTLNDVLLVQRLYEEVYHKKTPGTYEELYQSKLIPKFADTAYLAEGDLLFFEEKKGYMPPVKNVGIYLQQGMFLSCTAYTGGVTISDLSQAYWRQRYKVAGRLK